MPLFIWVACMQDGITFYKLDKCFFFNQLGIFINVICTISVFPWMNFGDDVT